MIQRVIRARDFIFFPSKAVIERQKALIGPQKNPDSYAVWVPHTRRNTHKFLCTTAFVRTKRTCVLLFRIKAMKQHKFFGWRATTSFSTLALSLKRTRVGRPGRVQHHQGWYRSSCPANKCFFMFFCFFCFVLFFVAVNIDLNKTN